MQKQDAFGSAISLNFRGQSHFQTTRGGLISFFTYLSLFYLSWALFERWFTRHDPVIQTYETFFQSSATQIMLQESRQKPIVSLWNLVTKTGE